MHEKEFIPSTQEAPFWQGSKAEALHKVLKWVTVKGQA